MSFATYGQIKTKVLQELDLEDEDFVQPVEMLGYAQEAVHNAESLILSTCEDYFLDKASIDLVAGQAEYDLPADIFADKIRKIVYKSGNEIYTIRRFRHSQSFEMMENVTPGDYYRYIVTNDLTAGRKITLFPTPLVNMTGALTVWYIRNARQPLLDNDVIDIPEFRTYIEKYMIYRCMQKEIHPTLQLAQANMEKEMQLMITALQNRFPDDDTEIERDMNSYWEHT